MSAPVTQEQHQDVVDKITDLRVIVSELAGKIDLTNERMNNTNNRLDTLIKHLDEQARQTMANRKWIITTSIGVVGLFATFIALIVRAML